MENGIIIGTMKCEVWYEINKKTNKKSTLEVEKGGGGGERTGEGRTKKVCLLVSRLTTSKASQGLGLQTHTNEPSQEARGGEGRGGGENPLLIKPDPAKQNKPSLGLPDQSSTRRRTDPRKKAQRERRNKKPSQKNKKGKNPLDSITVEH